MIPAARSEKRTHSAPPGRGRLWLIAAAGLILVQILVQGPSGSLLWSAALNAGHAPLYGLVALMILRLLQPMERQGGGSRIRLYFLTFLLTVVAGVVAELAQVLSGKDAEAVDVARDAAGASAFLLVAFTFDRGPTRGGTRMPRAGLLLAPILLLGLAFASLGATAADFLRRDAAFPRICGFEASWEKRFLSAGEVDMEETAPPPGWRSAPSGRVARLSFRGSSYPGIAIREPHPDWRGYKELVFEAFSELPERVELILRVHDRDHNNDYWDRFNRTVMIEPGANRIAIPLRDVESAPRGRKMDMSRIWGVGLFASHPSGPFVLYIDDLRLE